jgi:chemotaxis protein histidine kinase CheA
MEQQDHPLSNGGGGGGVNDDNNTTTSTPNNNNNSTVPAAIFIREMRGIYDRLDWLIKAQQQLQKLIAQQQQQQVSQPPQHPQQQQPQQPQSPPQVHPQQQQQHSIRTDLTRIDDYVLKFFEALRITTNFCKFNSTEVTVSYMKEYGLQGVITVRDMQKIVNQRMNILADSNKIFRDKPPHGPWLFYACKSE